MSKKNIEKHIPSAMNVLKEMYSSGKIPSSYNGYISSFGASIIQSGLLPTLALFENNDASTRENKQKLTELILKILDNTSNEDNLLSYVLEHESDINRLKQQILDISIALKLSIRTFELEKGE
jgi:CRISPR-associated protein Cmr5